MRFEQEGISLWYGTPDAPSPGAGEAVQTAREVTITVGVQPIDTSNKIEVLYRTNQGPTKSVAAKWLRNDFSRGAQYFSVHLPPFLVGDVVEYTVICRFAGRQVPSPEQAKHFASSFYVTGAEVKSTPGLAPEETSVIGTGGSGVTLAQFGAGLRAGPGAARADVEATQALLDASLARGQEPASFLASILLEPGLAQHLDPSEQTSNGAPGAFFTGLPAQLGFDASTPAWAHGMVSSPAGPVLATSSGLPAQLRLIQPLGLVTLRRVGDAEPLLGFALAPSPLEASSAIGRSFQIARGSAWFAAHLLASLAPASAFAGLRVSGGRIDVNTNVTASWSELEVPANATVTVLLEVEVPAAPVGSGSIGADLRAALVQPPPSLTITYKPTSSSLTVGGSARLDVYGVSAQLSPGLTAPTYDPANHDLLLPLSSDINSFSPQTVASRFAMPAGNAPILGVSWAIPVAITSFQNLAQAVGPGSLQLELGPGLSLQLAPLGIGVALRQTSLSARPDLLELLSVPAMPLRQRVPLWDERVSPTSPPRASDLELVTGSGDTLLLSVTPDREEVVSQGKVSASIDRPIFADGSRMDTLFPTATWGLLLTSAGTSFFAVGALGAGQTGPLHSLALENAIFLVDGPASLVAVGRLASGRMQSGDLTHDLHLLGITPILPDPYASNVDRPVRGPQGSLGTLTAIVTWQAPPSTSLSFTRSSSTASAGEFASAGRGFALLDVSTNADLLGLRFGLQDTQIVGEALAATGSSLTVFTVPGISWEPVEVDDPSVVIGPPPNDGYSNTIQVQTVQLVPTEPAPVLAAFVAGVQAGLPADMQFMLPFGLVASASMPPNVVTANSAVFELLQPQFTGGLQGGRQLRLCPLFPDLPTAGFPGSLTAYSQVASDVLGNAVWLYVEGDFGPGGKDGIVPVRRLDLSGYGTSMVSRWTNLADEVGVTQARFDVLVGRVSYEVIQVTTAIFPFGVKVVRTITLARQAGGRVLRSDSAWQPISDGNFDIPSGITAHRGPVFRLTNVHNIKDSQQLVQPEAGVVLETVSFDADVLIAPELAVTDGGVPRAGATAVPARGLTGYLQQQPLGQYLTLDQLGALMAAVPPPGGPLSCTVGLGGPSVNGPLVRVTGISVTAAGPQPQQAPELVVALLGTPRLPQDGTWSIGRIPPGSTSPQALDPATPVPLIRPNGDPTWHLADPADIDRLDTTPLGTRYGLVQGTGTQRAFFARPRTPLGSSQISLPEPPHLADVASLLNATGLFPDLGKTLPFDQPPQITGQGDALIVPQHQWSLAGIAPKTVAELSPVQVLLAYEDENGTPANATFAIQPQGSPSWTIDVGTVSLLLVVPPYGSPNDPLLRITGSLHADASSAPALRGLTVHYGGALSLVEQVFSRLDELASFLPGGGDHLDVAFSDGVLTVRDSLAIPNLPLGFGQITDVALDLGLTVSLSPPSIDFVAGIGSTDRPFHWLVSPLSGTGAVEVGVKDGSANLLVQAGLGLGLGIDLGIAAGSASVVIAFQVDSRNVPLGLEELLIGTAMVDVLDGAATVALTLSAGLGISVHFSLTQVPDVPVKLPLPDRIDIFGDVAVAIHISVCWVADVDFDGSWHFAQTLTNPLS